MPNAEVQTFVMSPSGTPSLDPPDIKKWRRQILFHKLVATKITGEIESAIGRAKTRLGACGYLNGATMAQRDGMEYIECTLCVEIYGLDIA